MERNKEQKWERLLLRLTKEQKEKIFNVVEKSSYSSASELIRAGIDKEGGVGKYLKKQGTDFIDFFCHSAHNIPRFFNLLLP